MPEENNSKKLPSWPDQLPKSARKMIFTAVIAVLMLIIVSLWLLSLKNILAQPRENAKDKNFEAIQKNLEKFLAETKNYLGGAEEQLKQAGNQNDSAGLSAANIEKLKEKLIAKETSDWQIYLDNNYNFELKYPGDWQAIPAPNNQKLIVSFRAPGDSADLVAIKRYASTTEILSLPNAEKHWPIDGGQLVVFDYINSTTSDLLIDTFELTK